MFSYGKNTFLLDHHDLASACLRTMLVPDGVTMDESSIILKWIVLGWKKGGCVDGTLGIV